MPSREFKGFHQTPDEAIWLKPEFVAGISGLSLAEIVNRISDGRIAAVKTADGYRIPIKQVRMLMGMPTKPPVFVRRPDEIVE